MGVSRRHRWLALLLGVAVASPAAAAAPKAQSPFPVLGNAEAWRRLPTAERGDGRALPAWARALAAALPHTTAALLEVDYRHRQQSPLDPLLRGKLRWVAARANRCAYGEAYAAADLRRAGLDAAGFRALAGAPRGLPAAERAALTFARKLSVAAETVTDDEVAELLKQYGKKSVVALVLFLAYANFQDRLVLALGVPVEENGPLPPLEVRFVRNTPVKRRAAAALNNADSPAAPRRVADREWLALDFDELQKELDKQRARRPRIAFPWTNAFENRWGLVCRTYQPELEAAWSACLGTFMREADQDLALRAQLLWVVTRTVHCYY